MKPPHQCRHPARRGRHRRDCGSLVGDGHAVDDQALVKDIALACVATAKYANSLARAKADGHQIITQMIPNMGLHYLNPSIKGFDIRKPPILVYEKNGSAYQLGAVEWVFTSKPAKHPGRRPVALPDLEPADGVELQRLAPAAHHPFNHG